MHRYVAVVYTNQVGAVQVESSFYPELENARFQPLTLYDILSETV